jgi:hypothetical protein
MTRGEFDMIDMLAFPLFLIGTAAQTGLLPDLPILNDMVVNSEIAQISIATLLATAALVVVIVTNKPRLDGWGAAQLWVVLATFMLVIGPSFVPLLAAVLAGDVAVAVALIVQQAGYFVASFLG